MHRLFWGLLFVVLDFKVELGSAVIGLLPDFIGWYLLMKGMEELAEESVSFDKGRHWAFALVLVHGIVYGADLLNLSTSGTVALWAVELAGFGVGMYVLHRMIAGIRQMEEHHNWDLQSGRLNAMWMTQAVMGTICHLLSWVPLVGTFAVLASAVTAICLLAAMYDTGKRYREKGRA